VLYETIVRKNCLKILALEYEYTHYTRAVSWTIAGFQRGCSYTTLILLLAGGYDNPSIREPPLLRVPRMSHGFPSHPDRGVGGILSGVIITPPFS
jgi:hypothetical protein